MSGRSAPGPSMSVGGRLVLVFGAGVAVALGAVAIRRYLARRWVDEPTALAHYGEDDVPRRREKAAADDEEDDEEEGEEEDIAFASDWQSVNQVGIASSVEGELDTNLRTLYVAIDTESTGLNTVQDNITQLAAVADRYPELPFNSYVFTARPIPAIVTEKTRISAATIAHAPNFAQVGMNFFGWLATLVAREMERLRALNINGSIQVVLIAHNGASFDFPLIMEEMARHGLPYAILDLLNVQFADSLAMLRKMRHDVSNSAGATVLGSATSLSLAKLYPHIFREDFNAHDALADVRALNRIIFHSPLTSESMLASLRDHTAAPAGSRQRLNTSHVRQELEAKLKWGDGRNHTRVTTKPVVDALAKAGITYDELLGMFQRLGRQAFVRELAVRGVTKSHQQLNALADFCETRPAATGGR